MHQHSLSPSQESQEQHKRAEGTLELLSRELRQVKVSAAPHIHVALVCIIHCYR